MPFWKKKEEEASLLGEKELTKGDTGATVVDVDPKKPEPEAPAQRSSFMDLYTFAGSLDWLLVAVGTFCAVVGGAGMPAFSFIFGDMLNALNEDDLIEKVQDAALIGVYVGIIEFFAQGGFLMCFMICGERVMARTRVEYFAAVLRQEPGWFDEHKPGEIAAVMSSDMILMKQAIDEKLGNCLYFSATCVLSIGYGFWRSWRLTLMIMAASPLLVIAGAVMATMMSSQTSKTSDAYAAAGGIAHEVLTSIKTVTAFNAQPREGERYGEQLAVAKKAGLPKGWISGGAMGVTYLVMFATYALGFWYGSYLIEWKYNKGGDIVGAFFAVLIGAFSIGSAAPYMGSLATGQTACYKIMSVVRRQPLQTSGNRRLTNLEGHIQFNDLAFRYPMRPEQQIFKGITVDIPAGDTVALVGHSGGGKSSIVCLLERFYDPEGGQVLIDGVPLTELDLHWLRSQMGIVTQDPVLFSMSIKDNIRMGRTYVTDEQIVAACRDANIAGVIESLPEGFDTQVGDAGGQLSGGQRQRVCIARAIVTNPRILLLDEATSALDRSSEMAVQEALDRVMKGRTVVVVAHRLVTIRDATKICFVQPPKHGENENMWSVIAEEGNHQALMALGKEYAHMVETQQAIDGRREGVEEEEDEPTTPGTPVQQTTSLKKKSSLIATATDSLARTLSGKSETSESGEAAKSQDLYTRVSLWRVAKMNAPEKWWIFVGIVAAFLAGAIYPAYSIVFSKMTSAFFKPPSEMRDEAPVWTLLFVGIGLLAMVTNSLKSGMFGMSGEYLTERVRRLLFERMLIQEMGFFDMHDPGELCGILSGDCTQVHEIFGPNLGVNAQNALTLGAGLGIAFYTSWKLALVAMSGVPLMIVAGAVQMQVMTGFGEEAGDAFKEANQVALESMTGIRIILAYGMQASQMRRYAEKMEGPLKKSFKASMVAGAAFGLNAIAMFGMFSLTFWYGGKLVSDGELDFEGVVRCSMAVMLAGMGVGETSGMSASIGKARAAAGKVFAMIDREPEIPFSGDTRMGNIEGDIRFDNVHFAYPSRPAAKVMNKFNLHIPPGIQMALIGETGCGKSTAVALLERFYDPLRGNVLVDGVNLTAVDPREWRNRVAIVSQEPVLFNDTIANNIKYGRPDASMQDVVEAAKVAHIHHIIEGLPERYETMVGMKGGLLSGGQRQRVAIARAIMLKPAVLLLDEATAALDNESEKEVQTALDNVIKTMKMTVVTIAHRLTSIQGVDRIAVVHGGEVLECGPHEELYAAGGEYKRRYDMYHNIQQKKQATGAAQPPKKESIVL